MTTPKPRPVAEPRATERPDPAAASSVRLTGLKKTFAGPKGPVRAVRGVDIDIPVGQTVALLGPNGAGKSTTIDMLLGLTDPDAGTVALFGETPQRAIRKGRVGAMLQSGGLIGFLSVRELLRMLGSFYPNPMAVEEVLRITGLQEAAEQRSDKLSGGQTQRVRAAMALVSNPDLLLLDEPTVAMDVEGRHTFWTAIADFARGGKTIIFATHYLEEADQYADRIIFMAQGLIRADGPANEIKAMVGQRTVRATVPGADPDAIGRLPGVSSVETRGESVVLTCSDSDQAVRALLDGYAQAHDIEVAGAGLEAAFLALTGDENDDKAGVTS